MSPRDALNRRVFEARRFRYQADHDKAADWVDRLIADRFNTPSETEERGYGDCDDLAIFAIVRGYETVSHLSAEERGRWSLVLGRVRQSGQWIGHAWVEFLLGAERLWADPTWGWTCRAPKALGYPDSRQPGRAFVYDGLIFDAPIEYREVPA